MFRKISNVIIILFLVCTLAILAVLGVPFLMGNKLYAVKTGSMIPTYPIGSIVAVKTVAPESIKEQDVITFRLDAFTSLITHRVIAVDAENREFYTKGDNNNDPDSYPVSFDNLEGKVVFGIPFLGTLVAGMRTPGGILIMLWILLVIALLLFLPELVKKEPKKVLAEAGDEGEPDAAMKAAAKKPASKKGANSSRTETGKAVREPRRKKKSKKEEQAEARMVWRAQLHAKAAEKNTSNIYTRQDGDNT